MSLERWIVPLEGHTFDSEDLPIWLAGGEVQAVVREGGMCLSFPASSLNQGDVLDCASQYLNLLNGAASLLDATHRPLACSNTFYGVDSEGQKVGTVIAVGAGEVRCKTGALGVAVNGVPTTDPRQGAALPILDAAKASTAASDALTIVGRQRPTWSELAVVRELAQEASGGKILERKWISVVDDERFRRTSNSRQVLGIEARHGHERHVPPNDPMTHVEALRMIRGLVANWLCWSSGPGNP